MTAHNIRLVIFGILLYFIESKNAIEIPTKQEDLVQSLVESSNGKHFTEDVLFKTGVLNEFESNTNRQKRELNESASESSVIENCIGLIDEGKEKIKSEQEEAVLVLGLTGAGKTTLIQFLAGEKNSLRAEEDETATGDFTIVDSENRISNSTIVSKTLLPELVVDPESGVAYYDCPGFDDTRGTTMDVAGAFFIREIVKTVRRVKILLIVNYSSVRKGGDRQHFLELVRHTFAFLKNVDKYANSIALVVTKVENLYKKKTTDGDEMAPIPDTTMMEYIAQFLAAFRQYVQQVADDDADGTFATKAKKLMDILTRKNGTEYANIGVFRRPDVSGPLDENVRLRSGKGHIKKMLAERMAYANVNEADFGYAISDGSVNELLAGKRAAYDRIADAVKGIRTQIRKFGEAKEKRSADVDGLVADVRSLRDKIDDCVRRIPQTVNMTEFVGNLSRVLVDECGMESNALEVHLSDMLKQQKSLDFLRTLDPKRFTLADLPTRLKEKLAQIDWDLDQSLQWYQFLNNLYSRLTSYEIQKDKREFDYLYREPLIDLHDENFMKFIGERVKDKFHEMERMRIDATKLSLLNRMLQATLKPDVVSQSDPRSGTYEIRGDFVMLSDVDRDLLEGSKFLNIFASNKIFLDVHLTNTKSGLHQVSVIAPTWEVVGHKRIVLNGKNGYRTADKQAAEGMYPGGSGTDGLPGAPGQPGGNFLGVGRNFVNGLNLEIFANGGDGSPGQRGGDGAAGRDGKSPESLRDVDHFQKVDQGRLLLVIKQYYCLLGEIGTTGGKGGNGGIGGAGGPAGNVKLITLADRLSATNIHSAKGKDGSPGLGGSGGRGGAAGRSIQVSKTLWWWSDSISHSGCSHYDSDRNGWSGANGITGGNDVNRPAPNATHRLSQEIVLNNYKTFFQKRITDEKLKRGTLNEFLKLLLNDSSLADANNIIDSENRNDSFKVVLK